jgi:hypothetical protein
MSYLYSTNGQLKQFPRYFCSGRIKQKGPFLRLMRDKKVILKCILKYYRSTWIILKLS